MIFSVSNKEIEYEAPSESGLFRFREGVSPERDQSIIRWPAVRCGDGESGDSKNCIRTHAPGQRARS